MVDALQRVAKHPVSREVKFTPLLWKRHLLISEVRDARATNATRCASEIMPRSGCTQKSENTTPLQRDLALYDPQNESLYQKRRDRIQ
jgi:hypothetical protein